MPNAKLVAGRNGALKLVPAKRSTIEDVAKLAGVGKVTVSYVLNGRSVEARISRGTAERVVAAARTLDYRPNALARMLASRRTETIAVAFQYGEFFSALSAFTSEVMRGVCEGAVELGYDLMLHTKPVGDPESEVDVLSDGRADGVLMLRDPDDPALNLLLQRDFPCVQFFTRSPQPNSAWVDADNFAGGKLATEHLIACGHTRIAMVHGPNGSASSRDRVAGYRHALKAANVAPDPSLEVLGASPAGPFEELLKLIQGPDRPTAIFIWSDDVALAALEHLRCMGLQVPRDLSLVGFDSLGVCDRSVPPLTSVRQPVGEMAKTATQLLVDIVTGRPIEHRQIVFPLSLEIRGSTGPAPGAKR